MTFPDAALAALYPVMVILGAIIWLRYLPLLNDLQNGVRILVCSLLMMVSTIILEQVYYGFGRFTGNYLTWVTAPTIVFALKVGYICSFCYMLFAFWMLAPTKPKLIVPFAVSFGIWASITIALMY